MFLKLTPNKMKKTKNQNFLIIGATALTTAIIILGTLLISNPEMYKGAVYVPYEAEFVQQTLDFPVTSDEFGTAPMEGSIDPRMAESGMAVYDPFQDLTDCFNNPENYTNDEKLNIVNAAHKKYLEEYDNLSEFQRSEYVRKALDVTESMK